jgi:hypothetical protein
MFLFYIIDTLYVRFNLEVQQMNASYEEEEDGVTPLIHRHATPTAIRDTREPYEKRLAVYFILASILFERVAFYSLANNLVPTLHSNETLKWDLEHSSTASSIFFGKTFFQMFLKLQ